MRRLRYKLTCAALLFSLNLATIFTSVYAWFTAVRKNGASGMSIQMYAHELDLRYQVYKYSDEAKSVINATDRQDALTLLEYDSVFKDRNDNTPILVEFTLLGGAINDGSSIRVTTTCSNASATAKALSNIIELKFALLTPESSDPASLWSEAIDSFESVNGKRFKVGNAKNLSVTYTIENYGASLANDGLHFFMLINYAEDLIEDFDFDLFDSQTTAFSNDLTTIACDVIGG